MNVWRSFIASGITLLLSSCAGDRSTAHIGKQVEGDVVLISYEDEPGNASGFFISGAEKACTILTVRHVLPASGNLKLQTSDQKVWQATNIQRFHNQDLALVMFNPSQDNCPYKAVKFGKSDAVKVGDPIDIFGFSSAVSNSRPMPQVSSGEVTAMASLPDGYAISYQTTASEGMVGGPVANAVGEVIAVNGLDDVAMVRLTGLKGGKLPPEQQLTKETANSGTFKWGIPIDIYRASVDKNHPDGVANSITPKTAEEWVKLGNDLYVSKRLQEAINADDKALEIKPDYVIALLYKGAIQLELKKYQEAVVSYDKAVAIKPESVVAWSNRGLALDSLSQYEDALASFDKAIKLKPDSPEVWTGRGYALEGLKRYEDALASFDKALQFQPDYPEAWNNRGSALDKLKQYYEALISFDKAIQLQPTNSEVWANRGLALDHLQRDTEAVSSYDKAIELQPDYPKAWYGRGNALFNFKLYKDALASYDKAIQFNQNYAEAWYGRGNTLFNLQQDQVAIDSYDKAIKFQPDYDEAWSSRGAALEALNQYKEALASYDKAIALNGGDSEYWNNRGLVLEQMHQYQDAIESYHSAIKLNPNNQIAMYSSKRLHMQLEH